MFSFIFFFNDTPTTEIYTLSLHDALPICYQSSPEGLESFIEDAQKILNLTDLCKDKKIKSFKKKAEIFMEGDLRSEEHTSELQSLRHLVCRLLLEKKKKKK